MQILALILPNGVGDCRSACSGYHIPTRSQVREAVDGNTKVVAVMIIVSARKGSTRLYRLFSTEGILKEEVIHPDFLSYVRSCGWGEIHISTRQKDSTFEEVRMLAPETEVATQE